MSFKEDIYTYSLYVDDFNISAFETIESFHIRSELQEHYDELNQTEKYTLLQHDITLLINAEKMAAHVATRYDFRLSNESIDHWWWQLDQVAAGQIKVTITTKVSSNEEKQKTKNEIDILKKDMKYFKKEIENNRTSEK